MKNNIFALTTYELQKIADSLQTKIEDGLKKDGTEILDIPTHIIPKKEMPDGKVLALDWGGTNFRAAVVEFKDGKPTINKAAITIYKYDKDGKLASEYTEKEKPFLEMIQKPLSAVETAGFKQEDLFAEMADIISQLTQLDEQVTNIGYCFSYPAAARLNGDAILLHWNKEIDIPDMIEKPVGESLVKYLNSHKDIKSKFTNIKVINDTVACLFAGLKETGYDAYIGLIVGTGTNMAGLMRLDKIKKLNSEENSLIPVNLESGNFNPDYLTTIDGLVDAMSKNKGRQKFEKAISGGYLGEIFKTVFMTDKIDYRFDAEDLSKMISSETDKYSDEQVQVARWICERSAKLVAASLAGLVQVLICQDQTTKKICLAADGSVFWKTPNYKDLVEKELETLLPPDITMNIIPEMSDPNLVGSAIAALS
ncbi:MAG: hexokinase [Prevotellaceae bacterium]|jgi:hexokinase|nr:hexokinase [Prevotellaceae bacterium]